MASLTIDQLKKSLTEQGIALPPAGSKKADYVRLYEQYSTLNENLGDFYSSDDENPPRKSSQTISSSSSPSKIESIIKEVERLTDDELYSQLKELGASIGPVLKNTRKVYEKKLVKLLGEWTKFSDSEVDLPSIKSSYKKVEYRESFGGRKGSVNRDSPFVSRDSPTSIEEPMTESPIEKKYSSYSYSEFDKKSPSLGIFPSESKSSKESNNNNKKSAIPTKTSSFKENIIAVLIVLAFILLILYLYFYQWSPSDPYKEIEEDAERELEHLSAKSVD
ncbi:UNVERIFIED_CONTAM: hypothetical protein PYX00_003751 [Menopon gallinae]|uniref:LEM domain-containing protein n=1 Tax=Menopon gallinae TaxID=328185 RepID=A0AAW2I2Y2_9NEOP